MEKKIGFVLSGGGFNGGYQAGVMHQLYHKGIVADFLYGTSVGAINAVAYSYGGATELLTLWRSVEKRSDIIAFNIKAALTFQGLYSLNPLRNKLSGLLAQEKVGPGIATVVFSDLHTQGPAYAHNVEKYNLSDRLGLMSFLDAIIASASIPGAVQPVNNRFVDGGVTDPLPLYKALREKCTDIYIILNEPLGKETWSIPKKTNVLTFVLHSSHVLTHEVIMHTLDAVRIPGPTSVHLYAPQERKHGSLDFSASAVAGLILEGQTAEEIVDWKKIVSEYFIVEY